MTGHLVTPSKNTGLGLSVSRTLLPHIQIVSSKKKKGMLPRSEECTCTHSYSSESLVYLLQAMTSNSKEVGGAGGSGPGACTPPTHDFCDLGQVSLAIVVGIVWNETKGQMLTAAGKSTDEVVVVAECVWRTQTHQFISTWKGRRVVSKGAFPTAPPPHYNKWTVALCILKRLCSMQHTESGTGHFRTQDGGRGKKHSAVHPWPENKFTWQVHLKRETQRKWAT